jgi:hypothetical protein
MATTKYIENKIKKRPIHQNLLYFIKISGTTTHDAKNISGSKLKKMLVSIVFIKLNWREAHSVLQSICIPDTTLPNSYRAHHDLATV